MLILGSKVSLHVVYILAPLLIHLFALSIISIFILFIAPIINIFSSDSFGRSLINKLSEHILLISSFKPRSPIIPYIQ